MAQSQPRDPHEMAASYLRQPRGGNVDPNDQERRAAAERQLQMRMMQMRQGAPLPHRHAPPPPSHHPMDDPARRSAAGSAVGAVMQRRMQSPGPADLSRSQQQMNMMHGAPPPPSHHPMDDPAGRSAAGSAVGAVMQRRMHSPSPAELSRSQQQMYMMHGGAPPHMMHGAPPHMMHGAPAVVMQPPRPSSGPGGDPAMWRSHSSSTLGGDPRESGSLPASGPAPPAYRVRGGTAEDRANRVAAENAMLREELRRTTDEIQRGSRLDLQRLEGQIARQQMEVKGLLADLVAAKEATRQAELRNQHDAQVATEEATEEAFEALRQDKEDALAEVASHAEAELEQALGAALAERHAAVAAAKAKHEQRLEELEQQLRDDEEAAVARTLEQCRVEAAAEAAAAAERAKEELAAVETARQARRQEFEQQLQQASAELAALQAELVQAKQANEVTVEEVRAANAEERAAALRELEERFAANPIIREVEVIKHVEVIKEVKVFKEVVKVLPWSAASPMDLNAQSAAVLEASAGAAKERPLSQADRSRAPPAQPLLKSPPKSPSKPLPKSPPELASEMAAVGSAVFLTSVPPKVDVGVDENADRNTREALSAFGVD